jgi:hypothetical protein
VTIAVNAMIGAFVALNAVLVPELAIIAAVVAIVGSLAMSAYLVIDNWGKVKTYFDSFWDYMVKGMSGFAVAVKSIFGKATKEEIEKVVTEFEDAKWNLENSFGELDLGMEASFNKVLDPIKNIQSLLSGGGANSMMGAYMSQMEQGKENARLSADYMEEVRNALLNAKEIGGTSNLSKAKDEIKSIANALKQATDNIFKFGDAFQKVTYEKFSPQKLLSRTTKMLEEMKNWTSNLTALQSMGVNANALNELRGMGLSGSGVVKGLVNADATTRARILGNLGATYGMAQSQGAMTVQHEYNGTIKVEGDKQYTINVADVLKGELKKDLSRYSVSPSVVNRYK